MSGNYTLTKVGNEYELKINSKMHDEWGAETETSMTLKINRIKQFKDSN